jgi:periplasmic protein TonB
MSYALSRPSPFQRSSLLGIVIALHAGIFLLILAARTVAPKIMEMPLIVDLLQPPETRKEPEAKPLPVVRPQPVRQKPVPVPKAPIPVIETTTSTAPAPVTAIAAPPENKAVSAAPAEESFSQARFDANYLRNPAPPYPALSKRMGEEGKVVLRVSVNPQGSADSVDIKTSSGSPRLDESAQKTVRNWKFVPAKRGDTPVQSWVLVPIIFKLEQ